MSGYGKAIGIVLALGWIAQSAAWAADESGLKSRAHTVAIVSALGDRIYFQPENVSLFDAYGVPSRILSGSGLDGVAVQAAAETLRADIPGVSIVTADIPRDRLVSAANEVYRTDKGAVEAVMASVKAWREANAVDLVVLLLPIESSLTDRPNTRMFFGMGVTWNEGAVLMQAVVLDGKTGDSLGNAEARALSRLDVHFTKAAFLDPAPEATAGLTNYMKAMLASTVPGLLHNAGL